MMRGDPPRRSDVRDPRYNPKIGSRLEILLNGVPRTKVIAFDCDAGTIFRFVTNDDGGIALAADKSSALRETLTGIVEVRWKDGSHG